MKRSAQLNPFLEAIAGEDLSALKRIAKREPELLSDPRPINHAALHGKPAALTFLLKNGADPNAQVRSHEFYRPLHRAIEHRGVPKNDGHASAIDALFAAKADPELRATWMGLTALTTAGMSGDAAVIAQVLRHKPRVDFFTSVILADAKAVAKALKSSREAALHCDANGLTPLHYAALSGLKSPDAQKDLARIATLLCDAGADMNASPVVGPYPPSPVLHFAGWGNNIAVARTLLERGANPNRGFGNALWREPGELAELFVKHGADVNGMEKDGQPILNIRVHWNLVSVAAWLMDHGADPNRTDPQGNTALHEAAARGVGENMLKALLQHGADPSLRNRAGEKPVDVAARKKRKGFEGLLKELFVRFAKPPKTKPGK